MIESTLKQAVLLLKVPRFYLFLAPGILITLLYWYILVNLGWAMDETLPEGAGWVQRFIHSLSETGKWALTITYQFIMITLLSPIMGLLAEKADNHLTGIVQQGGIKRMLANFIRTIGIGISAFAVSTAVFLLWSLIAWIGGLTYFTPYILFFVNVFFIGFAYMDYALERTEFSVAKSWRYANKHVLLFIGLGAMFFGIFSIPFIGPVAAPFLVTLVSTAWWVEQQKKNTN
jgi:uncharacterized protein involved in cysteine biosynthesis